MLTLRRAEDRGHSDLGWLSSYHTFSFGGYSDPRHMGFRALRVINDDRVAAGKGFGAHGHRDMEILSYVVDGKLAHKDSMGEAHELGPNEVQAMSAGNGVIHSEYNASDTEATHFLQIWIMPAETSIEPSYQQFAYDPRREARPTAADGRARCTGRGGADPSGRAHVRVGARVRRNGHFGARAGAARVGAVRQRRRGGQRPGDQDR